jgi:hypothetical protein
VIDGVCALAQDAADVVVGLHAFPYMSFFCGAQRGTPRRLRGLEVGDHGFEIGGFTKKSDRSPARSALPSVTSPRLFGLSRQTGR